MRGFLTQASFLLRSNISATFTSSCRTSRTDRQVLRAVFSLASPQFEAR